MFPGKQAGQNISGQASGKQGGNPEHENHSNSERFVRAARVRVKIRVKNSGMRTRLIAPHKFSNKQETLLISLVCEIIRIKCDLSRTLLTISQKSCDRSLARASANQAVGLATHCFRDISVLGKGVEILGPDAWKDVHRCWYRCSRVPGQVVNDRIRAGPRAI